MAIDKIQYGFNVTDNDFLRFAVLSLILIPFVFFTGVSLVVLLFAVLYEVS